MIFDDINPFSRSRDLRMSMDDEALWGDLSEDELTEAGGTPQGHPATVATSPFCRPLDESSQMVLRCS